MKKLLLFLCCFLMAAVSNAIEVKDYISKWGQLKLVGNQLSSKSGEPVQLKGWTTVFLKNGNINSCQGSDQWNLMHQYGANVVRLSLVVDENGVYGTDREKSLTKYKDFIKQIYDEGMYCIVDWHVDYQDPNNFTKLAKDFFDEISSYCNKNSYDNVIYEICSEPKCEWKEVKTYAGEVIPVILENQPEAMVIVGTTDMGHNMLSVVTDPLEEYKKNVLYSYHFSACSDLYKLVDFRFAQRYIPVFASEWFAVKYDGDGPMCRENSETFLADCSSYSAAPQLVSWCFWKWGNDNEASSTFNGDCSASNLSKEFSSSGIGQVGEFIVEAMSSNYQKNIENFGSYEVQNIPNTDKNPWRWEYYDNGGEGYAYHDLNKSAYEYDRDGEIIGYLFDAEECDAFSQAYYLGILDSKNPFYLLSDDGKTVLNYDPLVECSALDEKKTYKSLNAGKSYYGESGTPRLDEGVDLDEASLLGTELANKGYNCIGWTEDGEWINYTVNVAEPGYYKVQAYVNAVYSTGGLMFFQNRGNIIRTLDDLSKIDQTQSISFENMYDCADSNVEMTEPWNCWTFQDGRIGRRNTNCVLEFVKPGVQELTIIINDKCDGIGPLVFTKVADYEGYVAPEPLEFNVSPNPTTGSFTVTLAQEAIAKVEIVNDDEEVVYTSDLKKTLTIDEELPVGSYSVIVTSEEGAVSKEELKVINKPVEVENHISKWGQLKLVGNQLSSESGEPVQLKGWTTVFLKNGNINSCQGSDQWNLMHQYGANVVRLSLVVDENGVYGTDREKSLTKYKDFIKQIYDEGMYCIVDWHVDYQDPNNFTKLAKDFFDEISKYCNKNSYDNVIYEICSEPKCEWKEVKTYAGEVIPVILENQPEAMVIVGTTDMGHNMLSVVTDPLDEYKKNVLYSYHFSACSDLHKLVDFRLAQRYIPVFASEWMAVKEDGAGPMCRNNSEAFLADCSSYNAAPQLVSWCFWKWGNDNEASSTFDGDCTSSNLSKELLHSNMAQVGEFIVEAMNSEYQKTDVTYGAYEVQNIIPNAEKDLWRWGNYDNGGEGYAYHDLNKSAYNFDSEGEYLDYSFKGDECDAFSQAYNLQILYQKNPLYRLSDDGKTVLDYDPMAECTELDGEKTYKSLNAGKNYYGDETPRPDEGVDLGQASLLDTELSNKGYDCIGWTEDGEWINYTVNVAEPGYYKVQAYVNAEYFNGGLMFFQNRGNIIRTLDDLSKIDQTQSISFENSFDCADSNVEMTKPWNCWTFQDGRIGRRNTNCVLEFVKPGVQELTIIMDGDPVGIGPLVFTKVADYKSGDGEDKKDDEVSDGEDKKDDEVSDSEDKKDDEVSDGEDKKDDEVSDGEDKKDDEVSDGEDKKDDEVSDGEDKKDDEVSDGEDKKDDEASDDEDKKDDEVSDGDDKKDDEVSDGDDKKDDEVSNGDDKKDDDVSDGENKKDDDVSDGENKKEDDVSDGDDKKDDEVSNEEKKDGYSGVNDNNVLDFSIVPNPTSGNFTITLNKTCEAKVNVVNVAGQVVYTTEMETSVTIIKHLEIGMYTIIVTTDNGVNAQKLIVK